METMKKKILIPKDVIEKRVHELGEQISRDYRESDLIIVGVLKGAFIFMADLIRALTIPCRVDFARLASYGSGAASSGKVIMTKDIETSIRGRDILIVEDIVDTGLTLKFLTDWFRERNPRSLKVCAFLDKKSRRKVPFEADYAGFTVDDAFVIGYGLDFDEKGRFLPDVYIVE
ncbi:MAG: Hypoxanthine phosphoribosyltransferase [Syntrophus sp. PtaB.Bin001]|nr:MAG: Hypoxanthine phosphoribosyltransferase [Syntrophus sp. PtaB.Bin001]